MLLGLKGSGSRRGYGVWYLGSLGRTRTADRVSKVLLPTAKKGKNLKARCRAAGPVFLAIISTKKALY